MNRKGLKTNKTSRIHSKKVYPVFSGIHTPPALLERYLRIMKSGDIGAPYPGTIRMLISDPASVAWTDICIYGYDKTLTEWIKLIEQLQSAQVTNPANNDLSCPFGSRQAGGRFIKYLFLKNQSIRWSIRKFLHRVRCRIMDKRIVGTEDLYTTETIPEHNKISVYDIKTRNKYLFHTSTMVRMFMASLASSAWGIPSPKHPMNPYTNIPWTMTQCMSIVSQIIRNQAMFYRPTHEYIMAFKQSRFCLTNFFARMRTTLRITAAVNLFKDTTSPEARDMYDDILDFLFEDVPAEQCTPIKLLKARTFPETIMKLWDKLVVAYFLYQNHGMFIFPHKSYRTLEAEFNDLNKRTYAYWVAHIRIVKRRTLHLVTGGAIVGVITSVVTDENVMEESSAEDGSTVVSTVSDADSTANTSVVEGSTTELETNAVQNSITQVNEFIGQ